MEPGMLLSLLLLCAAGGTAAPETTEEVPSTHTPHVLSASKTVVVRRGEEAVFDCEVDELGGFAKVWKKDDVLYFTNDFDFVKDPRVRLTEDGSLRVLQTQPGDAGEYVCQISTERPLELRHRLVVIVPPSVEPVPGSGRMTVGLGQNFSVGCRAEGSPGPTVTWTRPNEKEEASEGTVLQVWSAEEKDSGEYRCTVSNGYDPAVETSILVDVVPAEEVDDDQLTKMEEKETDAVFPVKYEVTMAPESSTEEDGAAGLREFFPTALLICCLLPLLR